VKIKPYVEKLEKSKEFKAFKEKYPDSFMAAGFFILDLESGQNVHQIDFYIPSEKKFAAFTLDKGVDVKLVDSLNKKVPEELGLDTNIDLDALSGILTDEMHNRGISAEIRKIIAVIQNVKGKRIWNLNCVLSGMEILKSHIEDESKTVLKIEKTSFVELMKKLPPQQMKAPETKDEMKKEMEKLNKLESVIEKEKEMLEKKLGGKKKVEK